MNTLKLIADPAVGSHTPSTGTPAPVGAPGAQTLPPGATQIHHPTPPPGQTLIRLMAIQPAITVLSDLAFNLPVVEDQVLERAREVRDLLQRSIDVLDGKRGSISG